VHPPFCRNPRWLDSISPWNVNIDRYYRYRSNDRCTHLSVEILDGGVVFLHEMPGHELYGEGGFADAPRPQDHHLEFLHFSKDCRMRSERTGAPFSSPLRLVQGIIIPETASKSSPYNNWAELFFKLSHVTSYSAILHIAVLAERITLASLALWRITDWLGSCRAPQWNAAKNSSWRGKKNSSWRGKELLVARQKTPSPRKTGSAFFSSPHMLALKRKKYQLIYNHYSWYISDRILNYFLRQSAQF